MRRAETLPITPEQYEEIPQLTPEWFEQAELNVGGAKVGRPRSPNPKVPIKLRLDPDVVETFRGTGPGWQTRINKTLRQAAARLATKRTATKRKTASASSLRRLKRRLKRRAGRHTRARRRA